jgi:hypothetical protein
VPLLTSKAYFKYWCSPIKLLIAVIIMGATIVRRDTFYSRLNAIPTTLLQASWYEVIQKPPRWLEWSACAVFLGLPETSHFGFQGGWASLHVRKFNVKYERSRWPATSWGVTICEPPTENTHHMWDRPRAVWGVLVGGRLVGETFCQKK